MLTTELAELNQWPLMPYISKFVRRSSITGNHYIDCICGHTVAEINAIPRNGRHICQACFEAGIKIPEVIKNV